MQVKCIECNGRAAIYSTRVISNKLSELNCSCKTPACGHTFVVSLAFSRTLSPSARQSNDIVIQLLKNLPPEEKARALAVLNEASSA